MIITDSTSFKRLRQVELMSGCKAYLPRSETENWDRLAIVQFDGGHRHLCNFEFFCQSTSDFLEESNRTDDEKVESSQFIQKVVADYQQSTISYNRTENSAPK